MSTVFPPCAQRSFVLAVLLAVSVQAEQILFKSQEWSVSAPDKIDCSKPPVLTVRGSGTLFEESNRTDLQAITLGIAPALVRQCAGLSEVVLVNGRTRRLVALKPAPQSSVAPERASAPTTEPVPVVAPAPRTNSAPIPPPAQVGSVPPPVSQMPTRSAAGLTGMSTTYTAYQNRTLPSLGSAKDIGDKCEVLLKWVGRLAQEFPEQATNQYFYQTTASAIYLYRDEDFSQVFGQPFDQMTTKSRAEIHEKVIGRCEGYMPGRAPGGFGQYRVRRSAVTAYANQFQSLQRMMDGPFLGYDGPYSPTAVTAAIAQAREEKAAMNATLTSLFTKPPSVATFDEISEQIAMRSGRAASRGQRGQRPSVSILWPSEQRFMIDTLSRRRTETADYIAARWPAEIDAFGSTFEEALRLQVEHKRREPILQQASDSALRAESSRKYLAKLDSILDPIAQQQIDALGKVPGTLAGAKQALDWQAQMNIDQGPYASRPSGARLREAYSSNRARILSAALPEWKQSVSSGILTADQIKERNGALQSLFPGTQRDTIFGEYQTALTMASEKKQAADSVLAVRQCDALAAHPNDPEAATAGVADEKLNAAGAIGPCELSIKQNGPAPRLRFQLARAYLGAGRFEDATEQLIAAAEEGHGGALGYLADLHLDGAPGIPANPELAYSLYEKAAQSGFTPAKAVLAQFEDKTKEVAEADAEEAAFMAELKTKPGMDAVEVKPVDPEKVDFSNFFNRELMEATYTGQMSKLYTDEHWEANPLFVGILPELRGMASSMNRLERGKLEIAALAYYQAARQFLLDEKFDEACPAVARDFSDQLAEAQERARSSYTKDVRQMPNRMGREIGAMVELLGTAILGEGALDAEAARAHVPIEKDARESGSFDMGNLVYSYGGCGQEPVRRFIENASAFIDFSVRQQTAGSNARPR